MIESYYRPIVLVVHGSGVPSKISWHTKIVQKLGYTHKEEVLR